MTSNEKQIDLLMRRYAKAAPVSVTGHLDADELNAFAEGALPAATRSRYVSHLADCDQCRKQASDLTISSGAIIRTEQTHAETSDSRTFWQALAGLFALPVLRYAAFGAVLLVVAGVAFVALRRPRESDLIALNEPRNERPVGAVKPAAPQEGLSNDKQTNAAPATSSPSQLGGDKDSTTETRTAESVPFSPVPMKEPASAPVIAEKKAGESEVAKTAPSYAPPPPSDTGVFSQQKQSVPREQQTAGISGPRQQQQKLETLDKVAAADRERDANKDVAKSDDMAARKSAPLSINSAQPGTSRRAGDEKAKGPMRNMDNSAINRNENVGRAESPRKRSDGEDRASTEEAQTRSAGGRKFRRQGNAWVDQKFKSSMTLKSISRGSSEFAALDGGLRSIAQQLGGEVIVVWKDKAYLIK